MYTTYSLYTKGYYTMANMHTGYGWHIYINYTKHIEIVIYRDYLEPIHVHILYRSNIEQIVNSGQYGFIQVFYRSYAGSVVSELPDVESKI
jgi:hypothetical protein